MTQTAEHHKPIERLVLFDQPELVGARWWQPGVPSASQVLSESPDMDRRTANWILGGFFLGVWALSKLFENDEWENADDDPPVPDVLQSATILQKSAGWSVGADTAQLSWPNAQPVDVEGGTSWRNHVKTLATDLQPPSRWLPWALPTLLQMPALDINASLAAQSQPTLDAGPMQLGWQIGRALRADLAASTQPSELGLIIDLPGPQAVAVAAALAETFAPVFVLDHCPHPYGIVPAQETLGALLYLLPKFLQAAASRPPTAPPAIVLDARRMWPYADDPNRFDNRYLAQLPSLEALKLQGIRRVLYVTHGDDVLDDLVQDLAAWANGGIDVRLVDTNDFSASAKISDPFDADNRGWYREKFGTGDAFQLDYDWFRDMERPSGWERRRAALWRPSVRVTRFSPSTGNVHTGRWLGSRSFGGGSWGRTGHSSFG